MSDSPSEPVLSTVEAGAVGFLETLGLVAAIEAADAMLKASRVRLVRQQRTAPGLVTHFIVGETAAVRSAIDAGATAAERVGKVVARHVIPRPAPDVWPTLIGADPERYLNPPQGVDDEEAAPASSSSGEADPSEANREELESLTVAELRALARERDTEGLKGRAIASARKAELIAYLRGEG